MFFRSLIYPKIKKNENNLQNKIKLSEIIIIPNDENFKLNKKQKINNSPYINNTNNTNNTNKVINNEENICDMV